MPDFNPWAPTIEIGGDVGAGASAAGVAAQGASSGRFSIGRVTSVAAGQDNHYAAALLLLAIITLWALWQSKFRFSMTVG